MLNKCINCEKIQIILNPLLRYLFVDLFDKSICSLAKKNPQCPAYASYQGRYYNISESPAISGIMN